MNQFNTFLCALIFCLVCVPWTSGRNLYDPFHPYQEGPGEGCYSVCLSKEIKKLHEEINGVRNEKSTDWKITRMSSKFNKCVTSQIVPPEIGPITIPGLDKVEKTTNDNSEKLDELLRVVQNMTAGSSETTGK